MHEQKAQSGFEKEEMSQHISGRYFVYASTYMRCGFQSPLHWGTFLKQLALQVKVSCYKGEQVISHSSPTLSKGQAFFVVLEVKFLALVTHPFLLFLSPPFLCLCGYFPGLLDLTNALANLVMVSSLSLLQLLRNWPDAWFSEACSVMPLSGLRETCM